MGHRLFYWHEMARNGTNLRNNTENQEANLSFCSTYDKEENLKFDCVIGNNVQHVFPLHIHESLCIGTITKGQRALILSERSEIITPHELFIINPYQPHAVDSVGRHDYIAITINGSRLHNVRFENVIKSDRCISLFFSLFHALTTNKTNGMLYDAWSRFYECLVCTGQISSDNLPPEEDFIRKSINYMHTNYQQRISVTDIARQVCMSTFHFCRSFKRLTGLSPYNYLKQYRLNRSCKCLQQNIPVFDTAIETGFYDSSHFIRTFQTYMAVSPKVYQESITQ